MSLSPSTRAGESLKCPHVSFKYIPGLKKKRAVICSSVAYSEEKHQSELFFVDPPPSPTTVMKLSEC